MAYRFKQIVANTKSDEPRASNFEKSNNMEIARLTKINQHLEDKINRLYNMLDGSDSDLVAREKNCDRKAKEIVEAIRRLRASKKEIQQFVEEAQLRIEYLEQREVFLLEEIERLKRRIVEQDKALSVERRLKLQLEHKLRQKSDYDPKIDSTFHHSHPNVFNKENGEVATVNESSTYSNQERDDFRNLERKINILAQELTKIQEMLKHPISSETDNLYDEIKGFNDGFGDGYE